MRDRDDDKLAQQLESDAPHSEAWEDEPPAESTRRLAAQISLRLDERQAAALRRIAGLAGIGYTSLLRDWIDERLRLEEALLQEQQAHSQIMEAGYLHASASDGNVHIVIDGSGPTRWTKEPAAA